MTEAGQCGAEWRWSATGGIQGRPGLALGQQVLQSREDWAQVLARSTAYHRHRGMPAVWHITGGISNSDVVRSTISLEGPQELGEEPKRVQWTREDVTL